MNQREDKTCTIRILCNDVYTDIDVSVLSRKYIAAAEIHYRFSVTQLQFWKFSQVTYCLLFWVSNVFYYDVLNRLQRCQAFGE